MMGLACLLTVSAGAWADGPFDGKWSGDAPPGGRCTTPARLVFEVKDNKIEGSLANAGQTLALSGTIAADGTVSVKNPNGAFPLKFSGNSFEGGYTYQGCVRQYKGGRSS
jgi:hypothetical protein